jgi:hypothetical protein
MRCRRIFVKVVPEYCCMRRLRIYVTSIIAGLVGSVAVLSISALSERQQAQEYFERIRNAPLVDLPFQGGVVGSRIFGPGLFTVFLAVFVFAAVFYCLFRWQSGGWPSEQTLSLLQ